jgi:hypothetical protein
MSRRAAQEPRPPGWHEAIAAALRAAPEVSPATAQSVAGLIGPTLAAHLKAQQASAES